MVRDAQTHAESDRRKREFVDARNQADARVFESVRTVAEVGGRAEPVSLAAVENAQRDLKEAMQGEDVDRMREAGIAPHGGVVYAKQPNAGGPPARPARADRPGSRAKPRMWWMRSSRKWYRHTGGIGGAG